MCFVKKLKYMEALYGERTQLTRLAISVPSSGGDPQTVKIYRLVVNEDTELPANAARG